MFFLLRTIFPEFIACRPDHPLLRPVGVDFDPMLFEVDEKMSARRDCLPQAMNVQTLMFVIGRVIPSGIMVLLQVGN